jgi:8-oxo-dGTP pyrophosphatase MutT (NUDIX family)
VETFVKQLKERLRAPLPGPKAQALMSPLREQDERFRHVSGPDRLFRDRPGVRLGSVLVLLYPVGRHFYLPFMQRPVYNGHHSGQISFPGGKVEPEDPDRIYTALREAHEEIGVVPEEVEVLGTLSELYIPPSNYSVVPVVGWASSRPSFVADPVEVADIIEVPLEELLDEMNVRRAKRLLANGLRLETPFYYLRGREIWGATAMMLSELVTLIRELD